MCKGAVPGVLTLMAVVGLSGVPAEGERGRVSAPKTKTGVAMTSFGKTSDGKPVELYVLTNRNGVTVKIMTLGAAITEIWVPDNKGKLADVNLGFDDVKGYQGKSNPFFGCVVGRVCNRIAKGRFTLDGTEYKLATNNGPNHLHGGNKGFDKAAHGPRRSSIPTRCPPQSPSTTPAPMATKAIPATCVSSVVYELSDKDMS